MLTRRSFVEPWTLLALEPRLLLSSSTAAPPRGSLTPAQFLDTVGFSGIRLGNGSIRADGTGQTIAIIGTKNDPVLSSDLQSFDEAFSVPAPPAFGVVRADGKPGVFANARGDTLREISMDVEWIHAMAPGAKLLVVEASDDRNASFLQAVNFARHQPAVSVVSMSYAESESVSPPNDSTFTTPPGHKGITFVASSGDYPQGGVDAPGNSPNVISVGGTEDPSYPFAPLHQLGWANSGGGPSFYQAQPAWQYATAIQSHLHRGTPDVSFLASIPGGWPVYNSYRSSNPWIGSGGTSFSVLGWAALIAIVDQGRALNGLDSLDGATQTLPALYQLPSSDFTDITQTGFNPGDTPYSNATGYDYVNGRGTPVAPGLVNDLIGITATDLTPPQVILKSTGAPITGSGEYSFNIVYDDAQSGLHLQSIKDAITVSNGRGSVLPATLTRTAVEKNGAILATYTVAAPGGAWDRPDRGQYTIQLGDNQVSDNDGNRDPALSLGSFYYGVPAPVAVQGSFSQGARGTVRVTIENNGDLPLLQFSEFSVSVSNSAFPPAVVTAVQLLRGVIQGQSTVVSVPITSQLPDLPAGHYTLSASMMFPGTKHETTFATLADAIIIRRRPRVAATAVKAQLPVTSNPLFSMNPISAVQQGPSIFKRDETDNFA